MKYKIQLIPDFVNSIKQLKKKFVKLDEDIKPLLEDIEKGSFPGVPIEGCRGKAYKVRWQLKSANVGKRKGLRLIYAHSGFDNSIYLLFIYLKSETTDISLQAINDVLSSLS